MAEPGRLMGQSAASANALADDNDIDNDMDGEYEEDDAAYEKVTHHHGRAPTPDADADPEGSDLDAEGEEVDADDDDDDGEPVGAVKLAAPADDASGDDDSDADAGGDAAADSSSDAKLSDAEDSDRSSSESEPENEWQADESDGEGPSAGRESSNQCTFCGDTEENDPSEEYEEYLTCKGCGDNAHRQCARNANALSSDDDAAQWHCPSCVLNGTEESQEGPESERRRRPSSTVPKLARDLLPSHRGADPSHSMFSDLILPDDPLDGSRALRKRKASLDDEPPHALRQTRKLRRPSEASPSDLAKTSRAGSGPRALTQSAVASQGESDDDTDGRAEARLRSTRARLPARPARADKRPLAWVEENSGLATLSLVMVFHLNNEKVQKIVTSKPKKRSLDPRLEARRERDRERRDRNRRAAQQDRQESPEVSHYPSIQPFHGAPFHGFADKEMDETKNKPYGGILSEADADTSKTYPTQADRKRFEEARLKAEDDWKQKQAALTTQNDVPRHTKQAGPPSKIKCINIGGWEIDTWHAAPYPEEYSKNRVLYICEFCLKYMNSDFVAWRHKLKCPAKHPPGDEIYRDGKYSFFEVDGRKNPVYCQNLCLLAKLFLGSKTLYYDVEPFLFYVMTENDSYGCHFVGYFSKEKRPSSQNNVSCILVLPIHMRKGYGQYLIEFSYLLTRVEKKTGSPEKPLSDMGLVSYRKYWRLVLCEELLNLKGSVSIPAISERTGMTADDIISALEALRALVRDPVTKTYALRLDIEYYKQYIEKCNALSPPKINPDALVWTPYVMGRFGQYEDGPARQTVQPREDPNEEAKGESEEGVQQADQNAKQNGSSSNDSPAAEDDAEAGTPAPLMVESINGNSEPGTPLLNGSTEATGSQPSTLIPCIPPTRYEIYPPIPGLTTAKRKAGRPFGSRRRTTSTPQRVRNNNLSAATAPVSRIRFTPSHNGNGHASPSMNGSLTLRRTRSRLGETVFNGADADGDPEGGAVKAVNGRGRRTGTRSSTGSPKFNTRGKGKGKGRAIVIEDDGDGDGDGDDAIASGSDEDAEGDEDMGDAEGEDDGDGDGSASAADADAGMAGA